MPFIQRDDAKIYYETFGDGFPVLAFAPGYLRSEMAFWKHSPSDASRKASWPNVPVTLVPPFRVVAMDQRYAGKSQAIVTAGVGWQTYAEDPAAGRETVKHLQTPMLVLPGTDPEDGPHPTSIGNELVELLPHAELVSAWRGEADQAPALRAIQDFFAGCTPA